MRQCLNVEDFRRLAHRRLPGPITDFLDGGAEDERTMARNRASFGEWALLPKVMRNVDKVDARSSVMGLDLAWPFIVAPTGMPGLFHPDGEIGIVQAAAEVGALYTLSTMASRSIEEVAAATSSPKAFQLYLFRDRGLTLELLQRAKAAGYKALILTVDVQVPANRERDRRNGMVIPPRFSLNTIAQFAVHPAWCWNVLVRRKVVLANFDDKRAAPGTTLLEFIDKQFDPAIQWPDVEWVAQQWGGPIAIKGILSPPDAEMAVQHGAATIILSNHGGRQLDGSLAPLDVLPDTVERLQGRAEIIIDGGVRRGTDVLKALALGAAGCMAGRVALYGLAAGGGRGAAAVLGALRSEFQRGLALLGTPEISLVDGSCVRSLGRAEHVRQPGAKANSKHSLESDYEHGNSIDSGDPRVRSAERIV